MQLSMNTQAVFRYFALLFCLAIFAVSCLAQQTPSARPTATPKPMIPDMSAEKSSNQDERAPLTTFEEEMRAKRNIRLAEKEHEENMKRAQEVGQLAKDLQQLADTKDSLDRDDQKKVERLEKLAKKIRGEAGGEEEEVTIVDRPTDVKTALTQISKKAESLSKDVQNTPRQVVSASVIANSNVLLELIRLLRGFVRPIGN